MVERERGLKPPQPIDHVHAANVAQWRGPERAAVDVELPPPLIVRPIGDLEPATHEKRRAKFGQRESALLRQRSGQRELRFLARWERAQLHVALGERVLFSSTEVPRRQRLYCSSWF